MSSHTAVEASETRLAHALLRQTPGRPGSGDDDPEGQFLFELRSLWSAQGTLASKAARVASELTMTQSVI